MPGRSGKSGRLSWPTALTTALASTVSSSPASPLPLSSPPVGRTRTDQVWVSSDHLAPSTSVPKRMWARTPVDSAKRRKYSSRVAWSENRCGQTAWANE